MRFTSRSEGNALQCSATNCGRFLYILRWGIGPSQLCQHRRQIPARRMVSILTRCSYEGSGTVTTLSPGLIDLLERYEVI